MLLAIARERADAKDEHLFDRLGALDLTADEVCQLQAMLVRTGACDAVEELIDTLVLEATTALDAAPLTTEARAALGELAEYVAGRDH
jgi:geranylgeranyl diphosphate synthase type I